MGDKLYTIDVFASFCWLGVVCHPFFYSLTLKKCNDEKLWDPFYLGEEKFFVSADDKNIVQSGGNNSIFEEKTNIDKTALIRQ